MKPPKGMGYPVLSRAIAAREDVRALPDVDAVFGGEVELVGGLDVEGGVPAVVVADGGGAEFAGGVGIDEDLLAESGVASDGAPVLTEGDEELLVAGEVVDFGGFGAFEGGVEAVVGCGETGHVGDVFAEGLLAVDGDIGEGFVGVVLGGEGGGDRLRSARGPRASTSCGRGLWSRRPLLRSRRCG